MEKWDPVCHRCMHVDLYNSNTHVLERTPLSSGHLFEMGFIICWTHHQRAPHYGNTLSRVQLYYILKHERTSVSPEHLFEMGFIICVEPTITVVLHFKTWENTLSPEYLMMMKWCLMSSDVGWHIGDKLRPMPKHGSINLYVHRSQKAR